MIEELYKLILITFFLNICLSQDNIHQANFINLNSIPYQDNNTIIGLNLIKNDNSIASISLQNWFTENLYFSGTLFPVKEVDNLFLNYSLNLGYGIPVKNKNIKNIILNFGYNIKDYGTDNFKNISIGQIFHAKLKLMHIGFTYNYIDGEIYNFQQFGFELFKILKQNYIIKFGTKVDYGNNEYGTSYYITFNYCI